MKIRSRLLFYNILIVVVTVLLFALVAIYIVNTTSATLYDVRSGTIKDISTNQDSAEVAPPFSGPLSKYERQLFTGLILILLLAVAAILCLVIVASRHIVKKIMQPVQQLSAGAQRVQRGDYTQPIVYQNPDEFAPVIQSFNTMQATLQRKDGQLAANNKAKQAMLGGISHDLRTPLTVIKGNLKGVQDGIASTPEKRNQYLSVAYARVLDVEDMLNKLFATFNYETGEIVLNKEPVDPAQTIIDIVNKSQENLTPRPEIFINDTPPAKTTAPSIIIDNQLPTNTKIPLDQLEIRRVFENLINNAIKYHPHPADLQINIALQAIDNNLQIIFQDNGKGIKAGHEKRIFDEFYKEDPSRNHDKSSHGLGLFIVQQIILAHNGIITAENVATTPSNSAAAKNTTSHGLRFIITLPELALPTPRVPKSDKPSKKFTKPHNKSKKGANHAQKS